LDARRFQRRDRRTVGKIARGLAIRGNVALADTRARRDPLVAGIDLLGQFRVGDDPFRQETSGPGNT
jgi:hypothetical protein